MRKNRLFTFLAIFFLIATLNTSVLAEFDTKPGKILGTSSNNSGGWGYHTYTGTRYIFRIECDDGEFRDIGYNNTIVDSGIKNKAALYYINHFQYWHGDISSGVNMAQSQENYKGNLNEAREVVYMGSSLLGYKQVLKTKPGYSYFDTRVCSTDKYDMPKRSGYPFGSHRHITVWMRSYDGEVKTDHFDLDASDIKKLANTIKSYAEKKKDEITLKQINDIMEGRKSYQIRAEILIRLHAGEGDAKRTYDDKDISAYVWGKKTSMLTFREMKALTKGAEIDDVTMTANLLYEQNEPWMDEYSNLYSSFLKGDRRYIGWDYVQIDKNDPFKEVTKVKVNHLFEDSNEPAFPSEEAFIHSGDPSVEFSEKSVGQEGYEYTRGEQTKPIVKKWDANTTTIEIGFSGDKTFEITFWYRLHTKVKVIGVCNNQVIYSVDDENVDDYSLPMKEDVVYQEATYQNKFKEETNGYRFIDECERFDDTFKFEGSDKPIKGSKEITINKIKEIDSNTPKKILIVFYYSTSVLKIKHVDEDTGELMKNTKEVTINLPVDVSKEIHSLTLREPDYLNSRITLDGLDVTPEGFRNTRNKKKVVVTGTGEDREIIFYYHKRKPGIVEIDGKKQIEIIPNNLHNQSIKRDSDKYYWVLNQYGEIKVNVKVEHMKDGDNIFECKLKIPFDVYYNGNYLKGDDEKAVITINKFDKISSNDEWDLYEATIKDIYVPIWVTERQYDNVSAKIDYTYKNGSNSVKDSGISNNPIITVVGAVYDFTVTNLDGGSMTGDSMWHNALFSKGEEYKAINTPIGQGTNQPKAYSYAIKRGTRFYFSLNTLGPANNVIEITPSFYYVSADGKTQPQKVEIKSEHMEETRSVSLNDEYRSSTEFTKEKIAVGIKKLIFDVGDYKKVTLNENLKMPYLNIIKALLNDKAVNSQLSSYANHWYGDYSIPNDAKFYYKEGKTGKEVEVPKDGFIVVYFSIITKKSNNSEYLAYNLESPFEQENVVSQWIWERRGNDGNDKKKQNNDKADYNFFLPNTGKGSVKTKSDFWKNNIYLNGKLAPYGSVPVIIYSLKPSASTKQNVTSVGTH